MPRFAFKFVLLAAAAAILPSCGVAKTTGKIAAMPVKAVYKTGEFAGKSTYHTGRIAGKSAYHTGRIAGESVYYTGKFAGETAIATGKGVYYVGSVPVKITNQALDTTSSILTVTTQAVDLTGKVVTLTRDIQAIELDAELQALKHAKNIIGVFVDAKY